MRYPISPKRDDADGRGDQAAVVVVDPPGGVCGLDGQRLSSVDDADVDALFGNDQSAAAGDAPLHAQRFGSWRGWRTGRAGVAEPGLLGRGERVGRLRSSVPWSMSGAGPDPAGR
jgi:hypothetical protein